jgi:hypothetical protein
MKIAFGNINKKMADEGYSSAIYVMKTKPKFLIGGNGCCYVNIDATAFTVKAHAAIQHGVDGVIFTDAYAYAWNPFSAALTDNDVTWDDDLAAEFFNA